ncbi:MAG: hypothetical protein HYX65_03270 [Gemmatimonadetes bacterium]|nr:hypothetical protein [Gemmatimonadota bacterium]
MSLALRRQQLVQQLATVVAPERPPTPGLPTGVAGLDARLLSGGLPRGRLSELAGPLGSGVTTILRRLVARAIAEGASVAIVDASRTLDPRDWLAGPLARAAAVQGTPASAWGEVDYTAQLVIVRPPNAARGGWCADVLLRSGAFALVVLDGAPAISRAVSVRLMGLARERNAALLVSGEPGRVTQLGGSVRLRVGRDGRRLVPRAPQARRGMGDASRPIVVRIEKGGRLEPVEAKRAIVMARRVCAHPEVPDRRPVAAGGSRGRGAGRTATAARSRRCAEPRLGFEPQARCC